jgi:hypothetical protein
MRANIQIEDTALTVFVSASLDVALRARSI